jgi:hypothetical protein
MREIDSDNSANNSYIEFDQRDGPVNNFVAASNLRGDAGHAEARQQNQNQAERREAANAVIPERNV